MKTPRKFIMGLLMVVLFSFPSMASSQQPRWVMLNLMKTLISENKYAVGETCIIFSEKRSNQIYAFSTLTGKWDSTSIATTLSWTDVAEPEVVPCC